jgi:protein O-GlcNAc transferase
MSQHLLQQAMALHQAGRLGEAEKLYQQILAGAPGAYPALHLMGVLRLMQGRLPEALALMQAALRAQPGAPETLANLGIALSGLGRLDEALAALDGVVTARPDDSRAWSNRGAIRSRLGRPAEALADFDRAVALDGGNLDALNNRGLILQEFRRHDEALASFDALLARAPDYAEGRNNRGLTLREMGRAQEALAEFDRLIAAQSTTIEVAGHAGAWVNRAATLWRLERLDEALDSYGKALAINPDLPAALESRSNLLWTRHQALAPAIADLERALQVLPDLPYAAGNLLQLKMHAGDWRSFAEDKAKLDVAVRAGKPAAQPFVYQALSDSRADLQACARIFAAREYPAPAARTKFGARHADSRRSGPFRIGYVCGEFRAQATMYLAAGLFESHDRAKFEVIAFDNSRDDGSAMRARVTAAFDKFISIASLSDHAAAERIKAEAVDILVNLNGYFGRMRMGVFALSPAPIQVNYLGFPGSLGAAYMDYILADAVVIPPGEDRFYDEKVVRLPNSYQINDDKRAPIAAATRAGHGLPEKAFVFCHFNYGYKILPAHFTLWLRILGQVEGSVLWLLAGDPQFAQNLKAQAQSQGLDPQRLIFAPPLSLEAHVARMALGDLFLDSLPYNAHTTASDALWAGLPILTCRGTAFAGRVAASLLQAVGLPELVTETLADYEKLALTLARDPVLLQHYRDRLKENRRKAPLFDTARTTRQIEAAYEMMMARRLRGEAPQGFAVAPS